MKRIIILFAAVLILSTFAACGGESAPPSQASASLTADAASQAALDEAGLLEQDENPVNDEEVPADERPEAPEESSSRILIAYFTMPESSGVDAVSGASRVLVNGEVQGNMQVLAGMIQSATGGDLFAIETVQRYPGEHNALLDFASDEQSANARPELATRIDNLADYDTIFLGFPNWWYDMPMPIYSFLEEYDLSGKTIVPFNSHGGSGFSGAIQTIGQMQPDATLLEGFTVSRDGVANAQGDIESWLQGLGY